MLGVELTPGQIGGFPRLVRRVRGPTVLPITAIAADMMGKSGVLICWAGLVGINYARVLARRR